MQTLGGDLLKVSGVCFDYDQDSSIFDNLNFNLSAGQILGVAGANGAGKSTLLDLLAGLLEPSQGQILLEGRLGADWLRRGSSLVPQNVDLFILGATAREDLSIGLVGGLEAWLNKGEDLGGQNYQEELIDRWGLGSFLDKRVESLSVGQKKRLALASSLAARARLVLLDEPFAGLDWEASLNLMKDLKTLRLLGAAVVLTTHEPAAVIDLVDSWLLLKPGAHLWASGEEAVGRFVDFGTRPFNNKKSKLGSL
ncbi:MAG: ATP-binding cassette domain-containing protein [Deltaproteobacteria bacterium]|jgi:ABC-type multidrug transport system ATPase subunit|nr:ATP-binding cassette domain-containing protein [Deltaproteobacteria bacterium]